MISRTLRVRVAGYVPFDVTAEDVRERACPQKANYTSGAFLISADVFKSKAAGHEQVAGKKERCSFIVKNDVRSFVPGRWDDIDDALAKVQTRRAFRPMIEMKEGAHRIQVRSNNLNIRGGSQLHITRVMIAVSVRVDNQERQAHAIFGWQERKDSFCQRHLAWIRHRTGIYQQSLLGSDEKIEKICFEACARTLTQDESLRFVSMDLQRRLRRRLAILGANIPLDWQRTFHRRTRRRHRAT